MYKTKKYVCRNRYNSDLEVHTQQFNVGMHKKYMKEEKAKLRYPTRNFSAREEKN